MRPWPALALISTLVACAQTPDFKDHSGDRDRRGEMQTPLPQYPEPENYLPFEVSVLTPFYFYVDAKSLSVGADGVVRYTVIAKSSDGALNISFEGMRCAEREFRIYAFGRVDKTWSEARNSKWEAIRSGPRNAQRAALYNDYFCPVGGDIATAEDGVRALKSGGKPRGTVTSD